MKQLHLIAILAVFTLPCPSNASESSPPVTPIVISVDPKSPNSDSIILNNAPFDLEQAKTWLGSTSEKFGRKDPIIIQITKIEDFSPMQKVAGIAQEFYDDIFFRIPTHDLKNPFVFLRFDSIEPPIPEIPWGIENIQ